MEITSTPAAFSPALANVVYGVSSQDTTDKATVQIFDSSGENIKGEKILEGLNDYSINVSAYVKSQITIHPISQNNCRIVIPEERIANSFIKVKDQTRYVPHTGGKFIYKSKGELSDVPLTREICEGGKDELSLIVSKGEICAEARFQKRGGETATIPLGNLSVAKQSYITLILNMEHLQSLVEELEDVIDKNGFIITIYKDGSEIVSANYRISHSNPESTQICWINDYGAIDYYTFYYLKERAKIKGKNSKWVYRETVASPVMTKEKSDWLAQLVSSPKVWKVANGNYIPIEITTDRVDIYNEKLSSVEIKYIYSANRGCL